MALNNNGINLSHEEKTQFIKEILFKNKTLDKSLVNFVEKTKSSLIFNEHSTDAVMQGYTSGIPTSAGNLNDFDTQITPVRYMFHTEFDPSTLNLSSWRGSIPNGAINMLPDEYKKLVIAGNYMQKISRDSEVKFWNHITATTKSTIAGLTAGPSQNQVSAQEKALVASLSSVTTPTALAFNGVIPYMIYNSSNQTQTASVGGRVKVVGTTITNTNIRDEYLKVFEAIPSEVMENNDGEDLFIYAPESHLQLIASYNSNPANFKSGGFELRGTDWYFLGLKIQTIPISQNVIITGKPSHFNWCTDLLSDVNDFIMDLTDKRAKTMFIQTIGTIYAHVTNQKHNVLYVG